LCEYHAEDADTDDIPYGGFGGVEAFDEQGRDAGGYDNEGVSTD
jgi:hypothetical protein